MFSVRRRYAVAKQSRGGIFRWIVKESCHTVDCIVSSLFCVVVGLCLVATLFSHSYIFSPIVPSSLLLTLWLILAAASHTNILHTVAHSSALIPSTLLNIVVLSLFPPPAPFGAVRKPGILIELSPSIASSLSASCPPGTGV